MEYSNLGHLLTTQAKALRGRTLIHFDGKKYSYKNVEETANKGARALAKIGVKKGDRIAILMENSPEYLIALFTIFKAGAIAIPINNMLLESEVAYILNDSGAKMIITSERYAYMAEFLIDNSSKLEQVLAYSRISYINGVSLVKLSEDQASTPLDVEIDIEDLAVFIYTSGTTGFPKGAMLTHKNILSNAQSIDTHLQWNPRKFLLFLPMFHSYTLMACVFFPIYLGNGIVLFESVMDLKTKKFRKALIFQRPRAMLGVPQVYQALAKANMPKWFLKFLYPVKLHVSGGAPLAEETLNVFKEKFKAPVIEGYGLSEASPVVSFNSFDVQKAGTVGVPLPGVMVKIVDDEEREVPIGEVGELIVKGNNVMKGYWNMEKETKEAIRNGWLFTGDFAKLDEDNFITIVDRKKDLIITKGINVYPRELEELLMQYEGVEATAVIGIPTADKDETIVAYVKMAEGATSTEKEIKAYMKEHLASYKMPKQIKFIEEMPMTATGKVLKRQLKEQVLNGEV